MMGRTMLVQRLEIFEYDTPRGPWHSNVINDPTWEAIEAAISRLDRCLFPFIWLYSDSHLPQHGDLPHFEIIGGDGAYAVVCRTEKGEFCLKNPSGGTEQIDVWVSDQGTQIPSHSVCRSLAEVLAAAKYFFIHGSPNPESVWAEWP